ncbi:sensor histidine kinase [Microvirga massiliensis]|uniref:sensor histidine kinase n=1 Tax=Microvirga massiliensis TaxID=1033741 RepID=UPI0007C64F4E|nr:HAMP domain-containing sensor histidine kinase [Microvirga massiliensis]
MADPPATGAPDGFQRQLAARLGLSGRILLLTILFVMIAEVLIYVPSVANFRFNWLNDRVAAAQIAAVVLDAAPEERISEELEDRLLNGVGAEAIAVRSGGARRLLARAEKPPMVAKTIDLRESRWWTLIEDAFSVLLFPADEPIRIVGHGMGVDFVEIIIDQRPLRIAMLDFSRNILLLSLLISGITASLVYLALQWVIVRPVRRLTGNIAAFASDPENAARIIRPSARADEIGVAEQALAGMETVLADELRQKRRLAELGLAVSKINHELRNMLSVAQLLTDRLEGDRGRAAAQRVAPRLVATLDRAIRFCEATLAYGRAVEPLPQRRRVKLAPLARDLEDLPALAPGAGIAVELAIPEDLVIDADPDQISRVLLNLGRNAIQALSQAGATDGPPRLRVSAERSGSVVTVTVEDNGPGVPERARANLFTAIRGASRNGGAGLGLAITAELVRLHGGTIALEDTPVGARFVFTIPDSTSGVGRVDEAGAKDTAKVERGVAKDPGTR